jgi:U3 small nucleolar ribonucleoprotein protein LCP5
LNPDPLAYRPNPQNLVNDGASGSGEEDEGAEDDEDAEAESGAKRSGVYRPPKLAPMPYAEGPRKKSKEDRERARPPNALASLAYLDPSRPALESTSGLGGDVALQTQSARARNVRRLTEFEEENFTRLVMKKKDAKRRLRDEEDLAMGITPGALDNRGRRRRGDGLAEEFGDVLKAVGRSSRSAVSGGGDGYEELRERGKKRSAFERSRIVGARVDTGAVNERDAESRKRKRSRFEKDVKAAKKRANSRVRR